MTRLLQLPLILLFMAVAAAAMLAPAVHALVRGDERIARAFFFSAAGFLLLVAMIGVAIGARRPPARARSQLVAMAGAYAVLPLMMAIPFHLAIGDTTFFNAWFEMVSALTTTGATVYDTPGRLEPSLHLWRAITGWLGGFLVLVGASAILSPMDLGGAEVISGRVPGRGQGGGQGGARGAGRGTAADRPRGRDGAVRNDPALRLARQSATLLPAYAGLTMIVWIALLLAGMDSFVALCLALSTLSSSGITPGLGLPATGAGVVGEAVIFVFLCIGLSRRFLPGAVLVDRSRPFLRDHEVQTAMVVMLVVPALLFALRWLAGGAPGQTLGTALHALWGALFMTLSFLTTAGLESASWTATRTWSGLGSAGLLLAGLAIVGGGIATTTGGVKLLRVFALFKHGEGELQRIVHPNAVGGGGDGDRRLRDKGAFAAWVFFMLYALTLALGLGALTFAGQPFGQAMVLAVSAVSTTGPLATLAADPALRYADLGPGVKSVLAGLMVLGRMEVLAILALLAPSAWRR